MSNERDHDRRRSPGGPGTTSDPNQSNREDTRNRRAEDVREDPVGPVRGEPDPERRRDDAADPRKG
jgi:hypothetical protein